MFTESVDLMVCVAMVSLGENKDLIGPWMTFCESRKLTVDMSFYMHSLLFRYLDWNQSWMRQTAEVHDIQIDSNLKWLWPFRLINSFPAYHHFLLNTQFIKIKLVNQGLDLLNTSNIFRDHWVTSKIPQYFENLDPPLICYQYKKSYSKYHFNYNQVTSDPDVLSSIQPSWSCADSPFLYPPAGHVVTGDLTCIPDKGLRSLFKKGPKYRLPSRIDFTKCRDIVEDTLQTYCKRWSKKEGVGVHALNAWKNEFLRIIDIRIDNFTKHPHLYKQPPSR